MNQEPPFAVEVTDYEIMRATSKDGKTIFVVEMQMFNWTIKEYTEPIFWRTQW